MASRATDSDGGGSLTPSEVSDGEERSERDSDYETDNGEEEDERGRDKNLNIMWTGYGKRTPVIMFNVHSVLQKRMHFKTVGERYHMAFKFGASECKIIRNILLAHGFHEVHPNSQDFNLLWTNSHLKPFTLRTLTEFQKINHFPRSYELTRKDRLYKNIQRMQQIKGAKHFDFVPQSYIMPGEFQEFCSQFLKDRGPWIVKPVASSRGRGVFLVNHPDQVPMDENLIVSQYVNNPLVIDGFKFDVRLYVAVTSYDPLVIYLYEEGLTRFATVKYERSQKHMRNQCMHLTNYSVNKRSTDYVRNDDPDIEDYGNKWSLGAMLRYLRTMGRDTAALMLRIEDVVIKTLMSVELSIANACKMFMPYRGNCFELYGFDILVDDFLKPWVLEVNLSPSLACDSPLDLKIKGNMLCDLFGLAGIVCHDPMMRSVQQQSRRNQELSAKFTARAKSQHRPQSASSQHKAGPLGQQAPNSKSAMAGLNSEEIKILRRVKEEEHRRGGWIRIFPGPDTWDVHGSFLQFSTTHNLMLHQRLYPNRHKTIGSKSTAQLSAAVRSRNGYLQVTGSSSVKMDSDKAVESYTLALLRTRQYERKLGARHRRRKKGRRRASRRQLVQGVPEEEEEAENHSEEEEEGRAEAFEKAPQAAASQASVSSSASPETDPSPPQPSPEVKVQEVKVSEVKVERVNVVEALVRGVTLTKVQARSAFAMYLVRVQHRLISDTRPLLQDDVEALNEQMDLVLRFLKRAAVNLQQVFRVSVPSRKLALGDRRRMLAKQLGDFVHIYNRETDQLKQQVRQDKTSRVTKEPETGDKLDHDKFEYFVSTASENELEEVLTTYTKLNKSASIFLGSNTPANPAHAPTKPAHNPSPSPSLQRQEILQRRREAGAGDAEGGRPEVLHRRRESADGDGRPSPPDDPNKARSTSSSATQDTSTASHSSSASSSYVNAVSIYSQKLSRPRSASTQKPAVLFSAVLDSDEAVKLSSRPSSAYVGKPSPFSTAEPVVDTYNEQAIREALKRLAVRQQTRQYSTGNSSSAFRPDSRPSSASSLRPDQASRPSSASGRQRGPLFHPRTNSVSSKAGDWRPSSGGGPRYISKEDFQASQRSQGKPPPGKQLAQGRPSHSNVHTANPSTTFNNFIDESTPQWQNDIASAYNQVTGVPPTHYHTASVNSRQFQLAAQHSRHKEGKGGGDVGALSVSQQRQRQQRLMEQQSRALMEASKAKHHAMVAQAHAAQRGTVEGGVAEVEGSESKVSYAPKPPSMPRSKSSTQHRLTRVTPATDEGGLNFNFYNSLRYDIHTGQLRRKTDGK